MIAGDDVIDIVGDDDKNPMFKVIPVALNMSQIKRNKCPPNPAKMTDPRAKWYIAEFGKVSWELDSLKPLILREIAESSVMDYVDEDKYNAWIKREEKEKTALRDFGDKLAKGN